MKTSFLIIMILAFTLMSCQSTDNSSAADERTDLTSEEKAQVARELIRSHDSTAETEAAMIFRSRCAVCHGAKGNLGVNGAGDLTVSKLPLEERVEIIYFGKNTMTPFRNVISDAEIVGVARYVENLRQ